MNGDGGSLGLCAVYVFVFYWKGRARRSVGLIFVPVVRLA